MSSPRGRSGRAWLFLLAFTGGAAAACGKHDAESKPNDATCLSTRDLFALKAWPIMAANCTGCHAPGGIATTGENPRHIVARFVLQWDAYPGFLDKNLASLRSMVMEFREPKLLLKPTGNDHDGGQIFAEGSAEYQVFQELNTRLLADDSGCSSNQDSTLPATALLDFAATFRKAAIDLGGRLPTGGELAIADEAGFDAALDALMKEPTFDLRVKDIWNDVLLLRGAQEVGAYSFDVKDFARVDEWQKGYNQCASATDPQKCRDDFGAYWNPVTRALVEEPLQLIAHVVQKGAPFSEVLTADYAYVNPRSAIIYDLTAAFGGASDPNDWRELKVKTSDGTAIPHAGVLSTPGFLGRWVSTRTNINRARSRVVYRSFLATDVLRLAQRPVDASALTAVKDPTKNASACAVCHSVLDPVANSFSNYPDDRRFSYNPKITAATDPHAGTFAAGFGDESTPGSENHLLQWMTAQLVLDERFAYSTVRAFYQGLSGAAPLEYPKDPTSATFRDRYHAWNAQDAFLRSVAQDFVAHGSSAKQIVKAIVKSAYYRGISAAGADEVLADVGVGRLLGPEMLDRKILAVLGTHWGDWNSPTERAPSLTKQYGSYNILYGGIDSFSVTKRATSLNPVMSGVVDRMANEMACKTVAWDFTKAKADRVLFPEVELTSLPGTDEAVVRKGIVTLYQRVLGETIDATGEEANAAYALFSGTYAELAKNAKPDALNYRCRGIWDRNKAEAKPCGKPGDAGYKAVCYYGEVELPAAQQITNDKNFTIGSWMSVVTYLLSDYRFTHQ
jgi:hypothetical protein